MTDSVSDDSDLLNDTLPTLGEDLSHPEQPQDPEETQISRVRQVFIVGM